MLDIKHTFTFIIWQLYITSSGVVTKVGRGTSATDHSMLLNDCYKSKMCIIPHGKRLSID